MTCAICNAPLEVDGRPGCGCAARAARREDVIATAEDFHPLRIRPYVPEPVGPEPEEGEPDTSPKESPAADRPPEVPGPAAGGGGGPVIAVEQAPELPAQTPARRPFAAVARRGRLAIAAAVALAAVLAAVCGAAAVYGELTGGDTHRDSAAADDADATDPQAGAGSPTGSASGGPSSSAAPAPTRSAPAASLKPPAAGSPSAPVTTASGASASAPPSATASGSVPASPSPASPAVLEEGDTGPQVTEMQLRLKQTWAYTGDADGTFDEATRDGVARFQVWYGVRGDEEGVYGPNTRKALEANTDKP